MSAKFICLTCGTNKQPITRTRGSIVIELFLWLMMLIPGLIYSVWRMTTKEKICPACHNPTMIPVNTPLGKQKLQELAAD